MEWVQVPLAGFFIDSSEPYMIVDANLPRLIKILRSESAHWVEIDLALAREGRSVIDALKAHLPFPDWCGSSWDSIDDAFEELRQAWKFPLFIIVRGMRSLLKDKPHLGIQVALRMSELSHSFSTSGVQLMTVYAADSWE